MEAMKSELGSAILAMNQSKNELQESVNHHYLCDEVTGSFIERLMESKNDRIQLNNQIFVLADEMRCNNEREETPVAHCNLIDRSSHTGTDSKEEPLATRSAQQSMDLVGHILVTFFQLNTIVLRLHEPLDERTGHFVT